LVQKSLLYIVKSISYFVTKFMNRVPDSAFVGTTVHQVSLSPSQQSQTTPSLSTTSQIESAPRWSTEKATE